MEDKEDNFIPLSALQHFLYCERQCALIHVERVWQENRFTLEGEFMHEKVDDQKVRAQGADVRIEYGLMMRSLKLGITGKADVVEFHKNTAGEWIPYPVEYKRGKPKENRCDEVQPCAQALCLEEMMGVSIPEGSLYYGKTRHRHDVSFDEELRNLTIETIDRLHKLIDERKTPAPVYEKEKCDNCSLQELCMPKAMRKNVEKYIADEISK
ncbi:MAG TPA: CRISPR-associated protein Cas4 [Lentisphaeria bacterium]|nr:MAG: CRISPR-associated protein Cas4 [Lentisphaerae bacterium GWF2_50_93]HCE44360.1 CRISPR-associated protein Cas4 [Lentisphaeria bacterium]